ncbi:MAG: methyl-accepting chemotaxis protein [Fibrobacterales bacterium]
MNLKKMKLRPKLTLYFLLLGLIPLIVVGVLSYQKAYTGLYDEAMNKLIAIREIKKEQVEDYFKTTDKEMDFISGNKGTQQQFDRFNALHQKYRVGAADEYPVNKKGYTDVWDRHSPFTKKIQNIFGYYDVFLICADHGHVMYTNTKEGGLGANLSSGPLKASGLGKVWRNVVATKDMYVTDFAPYAPSGNVPAAFFGEPLLYKDGSVKGVLVIQLPLGEVNAIMQARDGLGETGETYLVGADYLMRSDSYLDPVNHTVSASFANPKKGSVRTEGVDEALAGKTDSKIITDYNGHSVLSAYTTVELFNGVQWVLLAEIDEAEALATADSLLLTILVTMLVAVVAIVFVALFIAGGISKPVSGMAEIASKIANGDLTNTINVDSEDEVGMLGKALQTMTSNLKEIVGNITRNTETVASASEELSAVSEQMLTGAEEMVNQSGGVASSTEQMSTNISTMASAAEEMSVNANEVAGAAEQTSQNMNAVSSAVEEMSVSINQIAQDASGARDIADKATVSSQQATKTMSTLSEAAHEIGNVTEVIKRIAEQTNLLALNATIEAASAGDAGKGFAVVANEIKELANQSAQAADDIAGRIQGVQLNTGEAVTVIDSVADIIGQIGNTVNNIAQSVEQQSHAVNDISANVVQAGQGTQNIAGAIAEVAKGANDVSRNSGEASSGAGEVAANIGGIRNAAEETNNGAGQVNSSSRELAVMAGELKSIVGQFTI